MSKLGSNLKTSLDRLAKATEELTSSRKALETAQSLLSDASSRLAKAAVSLSAASEALGLSAKRTKILLENWEFEVKFTEGYIDILSAQYGRSQEKYKALRFDRIKQNFLDKEKPQLSAEALVTLAQALEALNHKPKDQKGVN